MSLVHVDNIFNVQENTSLLLKGSFGQYLHLSYVILYVFVKMTFELFGNSWKRFILPLFQTTVSSRKDKIISETRNINLKGPFREIENTFSRFRRDLYLLFITFISLIASSLHVFICYHSLIHYRASVW